jgi:hypothetical protein
MYRKIYLERTPYESYIIKNWLPNYNFNIMLLVNLS